MHLLWVGHEDGSLAEVAAGLPAPGHRPAGTQGVGQARVGVQTLAGVICKYDYVSNFLNRWQFYLYNFN